MSLQPIDGASIDIDLLYARTISREMSQQTVQMTFGEWLVGELCGRGVSSELFAVMKDLYRRIATDPSYVEQISGITMVEVDGGVVIDRQLEKEGEDNSPQPLLNFKIGTVSSPKTAHTFLSENYCSSSSLRLLRRIMKKNPAATAAAIRPNTR